MQSKISSQPKSLNPELLLPPKYVLSEAQQTVRNQLDSAVKLLTKAGFPAKVNPFWVAGPDDPVGYITLD